MRCRNHEQDSANRKITQNPFLYGQVEWLDDGQCFMATSDDIDGLVLQADNIAEMEEEMRDIIPFYSRGNHGVSIDAESMTLEPGRDKKARVTTYMISHQA